MAAALLCREDKLRAYADARDTEVAERTRELTLANERLRAEMTERRSTEAALLQAQKVQAVGQLAGGIAHDFNNILQTVSGSASLVQRRAEDPASVRRLGRLIEDAGRRAHRSPAACWRFPGGRSFGRKRSTSWNCFLACTRFCQPR